MAPSTEVKRAEDARPEDWYTALPWTEGDDHDLKGKRFRSAGLKLRQRRAESGSGLEKGNTAAGSGKDELYGGDEGMDSESDSESEDKEEEDDEKDDEGDEKDKGDEQKETTTTLRVTSSATETVTTTPTALPDTQAPPSISIGNTHNDIHGLLIGVGTVIGVLILAGLCFIGWKLRQRALTRRKDPLSQDLDFRKPNPAQRALTKMPFFEKHFGPKEWYHIEEPSSSPRGSLDKKVNPNSAAWLSRRFEAPSFARTHDKVVGASGLKIDTTVSQREVASDEVSPTSTMLGGETAVYASKEGSNRSSGINNNTSTGPPPYSSPAQRQTVVSDMSSLSSGFGDGDIIMPPPATASSPAHRSTLSAGNRETVYTEASEDSPPRFRTVNSWVRQQSGRVRREQRDESTPPVPVLPPLEFDLGMMMPDGQTPRRVDMGK